MECEHLLIDTKNMLYRAAYVHAYDKKFKKSKHHPINIVLHFLTSYLNRFNPKQIHIFWDSPRSETWRKKSNSFYKDGRGGSKKISNSEMNELMNNLIEVSMFLFKNMCFRQYYCDSMEADDLIYAFCKINPHDETIIISSDADLKQITYHYPNIKIHSHLSKTKRTFELTPKIDPVIVKCFTGDKSDNIDGYHKVGPVRAKVLTEDTKKRYEFFQSDKAIARVDNEIRVVGNKRFKRNLRLIDLSLCPYLLDNMMYVSNKQFEPVEFNLGKIRDLISKYKLRGVTADISRYVGPFKRLAEVKNGS